MLLTKYGLLVCRKFTSITEEDHSSIFEPVEAMIKLSAKLCIAVCDAPSLATITVVDHASFLRMS